MASENGQEQEIKCLHDPWRGALPAGLIARLEKGWRLSVFFFNCVVLVCPLPFLRTHTSPRSSAFSQTFYSSDCGCSQVVGAQVRPAETGVALCLAMTTSSVKATWTFESTDTSQIKQKFVRDTRFSRRTFQEFKRILQNRIQQKHLQRLLQNRMQKKHLVDATRWCGVCVCARAFSYNTGNMCISRISELMSYLCGFKPLKVWNFCTSRSSFECHA